MLGEQALKCQNHIKTTFLCEKLHIPCKRPPLYVYNRVMEENAKNTDGMTKQKRLEAGMFLFLAFVLAPMLAIAGVGSYGLVIWIWQLLS